MDKFMVREIRPWLWSTTRHFGIYGAQRSKHPHTGRRDPLVLASESSILDNHPFAAAPLAEGCVLTNHKLWLGRNDRPKGFFLGRCHKSIKINIFVEIIRNVGKIYRSNASHSSLS